MKINVDRMARLAGLSKNSSRSSKSLNEGMSYDHMEEMYEEESDFMEEIIEVDEVELVQELRRAKKIMLESKKRKTNQSLQELKLQKIIEEEVQNIFGEMDLNLNSDWVYGSNKPKRSKKGYSHQGSFLKGIGFK